MKTFFDSERLFKAQKLPLKNENIKLQKEDQNKISVIKLNTNLFIRH